MAFDPSDYTILRTLIADPVTVTVRQRLATGDLQDTVTDAKRVPGRELRRSFPGATITEDSVGYVIWLAALTNCTQVNGGDEIEDGSDTFVVNDVTEGGFEAAKQFICKCSKRVSVDG